MSTFRENLRRLFTRNVIIKRQPGNRLKAFDVNKAQSMGSPNTYNYRTKWRNGRSFSSVSGYGSGFTNTEIESLRKQMYIDYELMDTDSLISSALDIYSDETISDSFDNQPLVIRTDNVKIKKILHNLFYDIMNIEFNLWAWVRTTCKYGDSFLFLDLREEYGVVNVVPVHPALMMREEGTPENPYEVKFRYEGDSGFYTQTNVFDAYEIAHFRILTDTNFLPYGRSIIEPGRKEYKRMTLLEDAMMIHRIMRAPERRIFKIDVGNLAPQDIEAHIEQIIQETKKIPYIDPQTGDYNLKFNIQPVAWYTKIPLLDGRIVTIKELSEEIGIQPIWVYSIDVEDNNKIVPGKVTWCGLTKKDADIVRIYLDDESYIDFEPNHPVMLRDGSYMCAKDLVPNQSLMPFYTKLSDYKNLNGYELIYNPKSEQYEVTHRLVAKELNIDNYNNTKNVVHHKNFKKLDNSPENLDCSMTYFEHIEFHSKNASNIWKNKIEEEKIEINKKRSESHKKRFKNGAKQWNEGHTKETHDSLKGVSERMKKENNPERGIKISLALTGKKRPNHSQWMKDNYIPYERTEEQRKKSSEQKIGENNPNFGKTWEQIHGVEGAEKLRELVRETNRNRDPIEWTDEMRKNRSEFMSEENRKRYSNPEYKERVSIAMKDKFDDYLFDSMCKIITKNPNIICLELISIMNSIPGLYDHYLQLNIGRKKPKEFKLRTIQRAFNSRGFNHYVEFKKFVLNSEFLNHKVLKVEYLIAKEDVYCMTVDKYHNFAIDSHLGTDRNGIFVKNSSIEDIYMPVRGSDNGTSIDTLNGLENAGQIDDVKYIKQKLMAALKIPESYLNASEGGEAKASLAGTDIRFAKTIERIQKMIVSELYKIAVIHLYIQGHDNEDLLNFELELTSPSLIYERQKMDLLNQRIESIATIKENNLFSDKYIYEQIFGMSEEEWKADRLQLVEDLKFQFRAQQIKDEGNDPAVTGKSFGTAHDIASMQMASKFGETGNSEEIKKFYTPDERENNPGNPGRLGNFETKRDQDFGRDPVGRRESGSSPKPAQESIDRLLKNLSKFKRTKESLQEQPKKDPELGMLNEDNILDDE